MRAAMNQLKTTDIYRAAQLLIDRHGDAARARADARADQLEAEGDDNAQELWRRISEAIDDLRRSDRPSGTWLH